MRKRLDVAGFGRRLREARGKAGLSQRELATRTGLTQSTLSMYENAVRVPDVISFALLCDTLVVDANDMLGRELVHMQVHLEGETSWKTPADSKRFYVST